MTRKLNILLSIAVLLLLALFFFIIVSEHGLADLRFIKKERDRLVEDSKRLSRENLTIGIEIDRLKHDPAYIEISTSTDPAPFPTWLSVVALLPVIVGTTRQFLSSHFLDSLRS